MELFEDFADLLAAFDQHDVRTETAADLCPNLCPNLWPRSSEDAMTWDPAPRRTVRKRADAPAEATLLAIDLGLKCGFAVFDTEGTLVGYHSTRFPRPSALKAAAWNVLMRWPNLERIVAEGDAAIADQWRKLADKRGIAFERIGAEAWRVDMLKPSERTDGSTAKAAARRIAERIIASSNAPKPKARMTHDVCEAIVIGAWATSFARR